MTNTQKALGIIWGFFEDEFGEEEDMRDETLARLSYDLRKVPIAYTEDDEWNGLQVYADLVGYRLIYTKAGVTVETENYDNYEDFEQLALTQLDFDELISHCNGNFGEV